MEKLKIGISRTSLLPSSDVGRSVHMIIPNILRHARTATGIIKRTKALTLDGLFSWNALLCFWNSPLNLCELPHPDRPACNSERSTSFCTSSSADTRWSMPGPRLTPGNIDASKSTLCSELRLLCRTYFSRRI